MTVRYIDSEKLEKENPSEVLAGLSGILVPGGFGSRGIEGKISAVRFARENHIHYLGICMGLQVAIIEYARNVCGIQKATSREFSNTGEFVIDLLDEQKGVEKIGGSMRLGSYQCKLLPNSLAAKTYGKNNISERHRHRFELNNHYRNILTQNGVIFSGINQKLNLIEMAEITDHPWFITCQFHPEFKSKPFKPHPLFVGLIGAALKHSVYRSQSRKKKKTKAKGKRLRPINRTTRRPFSANR